MMGMWLIMPHLVRKCKSRDIYNNIITQGYASAYPCVIIYVIKWWHSD